MAPDWSWFYNIVWQNTIQVYSIQYRKESIPEVYFNDICPAKHSPRPFFSFSSSDGASVQLRCTREAEAAVYIAMDPLPVLDSPRVMCPVTLALGGQAEGIHARLLQAGVAVQREMRYCRLKR